MNFQEQLKYDKFQKLQERLQTNGVQSGTKAIVQTIQTDVSDAIIVKQEVIKKSEIAGLDAENYGAPPENSGIVVYKKGMKYPDISITEAHAREDENGNWLYNYPGAMQLATILGRTLPDIDQLITAISTDPNSFRQNAGFQRASEKLATYIKTVGKGRYSKFWSSTRYDEERIYIASIKKGESVPKKETMHNQWAIPVRFIVDKE